MKSATPILIPLLNPNEPEAVISDLSIENGQEVSEGDILCTLETTKSTADVMAESDGFVVGLQVKQGVIVKSGELLCYLAEQADWQPPKEEIQPPTRTERFDDGVKDLTLPEGLRITQPALSLAIEAGIELNRFPLDRLVTENLVRSFIQDQPAERVSPGIDFDPTAILIYGGGGHGKALIELVKAMGSYHIVGIVDDGISPNEKILGYRILGGAAILEKLYRDGVRLAVNAVGGIGNLGTRIKVFQQLSEAGFACPAVNHPTAFLEPSAIISPGVQVFPKAYVGSEARLGYGCIVNTGAIVSHDCSLGDHTNLSPGSILAGEVQIGSSVLVGMGVTINLRVRVGNRARIGNGATVKEDVPEGAIVRAGTIWPE